MVTEDHSLINDYIKMKRITQEEAAAWPHKNVIVRALGMKESVQVNIHAEKPRVGDVYLLCSDGLSGMIEDDGMRSIVQKEQDLDKAADRLIDAANAAGGVDNITGDPGADRAVVTRTLLVLVLACSTRQPSEGTPSGMSLDEQREGLAVCEHYVEKVCACADRDPSRREDCERAQAQPSAMRMHMQLLQEKQQVKPLDRAHVEVGARKLVRACREADETFSCAR